MRRDKRVRRARLAGFVVWLAIASLAWPADPWPGVDETVIEQIAADAGRPPREPYINTDQGDLLLFLFLASGAVGGFVAGYTFRGLFPPNRNRLATFEKKVSGTICAKHPKGRFPANGS